jgi:hypothetical protein
MKVKDIQAIKSKRYDPLSIQDIIKVSRAIKSNETLKDEHGDMLGEFALRVSLQLQHYPQAIEISKKEIERNAKTTSDILREIADSLEC